MSRRLLAVALLCVLVVSSGCLAFFGGNEVDRDRLAEERDYDWDTTANTTITVERSEVHLVYDVTNRTTLEVWRFERFNDERSVDPVALRFRYPNGTVVGPDAMTVTKTRARTTIALPARDGQVALTLPKRGKRVRLPVLVEGSHELVLPASARVRYWLLGRVVPAADERTLGDDGRVHLRWDEVPRDSLVVEYYLERDLLIFGSLLGLGLVALAAVLGYFYLQLRALREQRREVAWDDRDGAP